MLEEEKVVEAEEVKEAPVAEEPKQEQPAQQGGMQPASKNALISFILAVVGFGFAFGWWIAIVGTILGIISLVFLKKSAGVSQQPFSTFAKVARILAIIAIIVGAIMFLVAIIYSIVVFAIYLAEAAAQGA